MVAVKMNANGLKRIWNFLRIEDPPEPCDVIFAFGRDDLCVADRVGELYAEGVAPMIVLAGGQGRCSGRLEIPEALAFQRHLIERGLPEAAMLLETTSRHCGENVELGFQRIFEKGLACRSAILVSHGPNQRRAWATAMKHHPEIHYVNAPDACTFDVHDRSILEEMAAEMERLVTYPVLGYITAQVIPPDVMEDYLKLKKSLEGG